jgi:hypothetical protein
MIGALGSALLLLLGAIVLGNGALAMVQSPRLRASAPLVGMAVLIVGATALIRLPGHAITASVVLALACVAVLGWLGPRGLELNVAQVVTGLLVVGFGVIPFFMAGRFGMPGVGLNNDLGFHLLLADELAAGRDAALAPWLAGYPFGGHALSAAISVGGPGSLSGFVGVLLAVPALGAMCAAAMFRDVARWRAVGIGLLVGLTYPVLVWAGQGRLKEPIVAMLIIGLVASLRELPSSAPARARVLPGVLIGAMVVVYGPGALVPVAVLGLVAWVAGFIPGVPKPARLSLRAGGWLVGTIVFCVLPMGDRLLALNPVSAAEAQAAGGPQEHLAPIAALGAWPTRDFRYSPADLGMVSATTLIVMTVTVVIAVAAGLAAHVVRRDTVVVAALVGVSVAYLVTSASQGPYVTSKTVVLAAPVLALVTGGCLLPVWRSGLVRTVTVALGALALALSAASGATTLSYSPVGPLDATVALQAFRPRVQGAQVLVLVDDDYAPWALRGASVTPLYPYMVTPAVPITPVARKMTPWGPAVDLDSIRSIDLRRFQFVVAPAATASSAPPPGWSVVQRSGPLVLLAASGAQTPRSSAERGLAWTARSACARGAPRALGLPVTGSVLRRADEWVRAGGPPFPLDGVGLTLLPPGDRATITLALSRGRYEVDLAYRAGQGLEVIAGGVPHVLMPLLTMSRTPMPVGEIDWPGGEMVVEARAANRDGARRAPDAALGALRVVRLPRPAAVVPVERACPGYTDWTISAR